MISGLPPKAQRKAELLRASGSIPNARIAIKTAHPDRPTKVAIAGVPTVVMTVEQETQVIIVGGGPVGLALDIDRRGVRSILIEQKRGSSPLVNHAYLVTAHDR